MVLKNYFKVSRGNSFVRISTQKQTVVTKSATHVKERN